MISDLHIHNDLEPLSLQDSVGLALERLDKNHLDILPVVQDERLVNYASLRDMESMDRDRKLSELPLYASLLPSVTMKQHLLDALNHLKTLDLPLVAVLDENHLYAGVLRTSDVVMELSRSLSIKSAGSIIVVRVRPLDYSLSDISRIIEYSDAKILGFITFEVEETGEIEIHMKLNTTSLKHILATLERYDYHVVQYFNREDLTDDTDSRYENLMKYIDI